MSARRRIVALLAALALATLALATTALAAEPKTSVTDISDEVMCVVCGVPLNIAEAPQAERERSFIQDLIDEGLTKDQIKARLVTEYGESVLADPTGGGIATATWLVPLLLLLAALGGLAVVVPRWRARRRAGENGPDAEDDAPAPLDAEEEQRLEDDLARYR